MTQPLGSVMVDVAGLTLARDERELLARPAVGGVILFARNCASPEQVLELSREIRSVNPHLLIAIDQEGGRVQRLREGVTRLPSMRSLAQCCLGRDCDGCGEDAQAAGLGLARDAGWLLGMEMAAIGCDITFAPVLDIDVAGSTIIGDRSFGATPEDVIAVGGAFIDGLQEAGMSAVGKHYPGHGGISADTHLERVVDPRPFRELREHDLKPFAALAERLGGVMPAHVIYPDFDARPAGFSPSWLGLLREEFGFKGAIFSDDLGMAAAVAEGGPAERARLALDAGCDMALVCNDPAAAREVLDSLDDDEQRHRGKRQARLRYARARPTLDGLVGLARWRRTHARLESMAASQASQQAAMPSGTLGAAEASWAPDARSASESGSAQ
ncbi:beta-N-acetylhexosaminidase [Cobetia amphilecti]|uniref:beta-N-acetylhexosaminidase n=1 Tax=Cobetia amphilecti TaxID=1055104 RepID=UPI000D1AF0A8|nr:beta-N-acetylhexosaminidase [Cobetia amphilecti]AVV33433.1 beta-N-acetylhexosaminidase [Halomonas sp. SF2003]MDO6815709.1 beta-N-acetylhexosaminidase [Cobetia amphilecti]